jgi:OmpA-OmpF porin, OOP family
MTISRRRLLVLGLLAGVAACSTARAATAGDGLAVVVGGRANSAPPALLADLEPLVLDALARDTQVTVIVADGLPSVVDSFRLTRTAQNQLTADQEQKAAVARVRQAIERVRAKAPEVDDLAALVLAARSVSGAPGLRRVLMLDSGVQTTGGLRFQDDDGATFAADASDLATSLRDHRQLPDLRDVEVTMAGLGDVRAPQGALGEPRRQALTSIWSAIVTRAGGRPVVVPTPAPDRPIPAGLPRVSVVPTEPVPSPGPLSAPVVLREDTVGFLPDVATLRDPAAAAVALAPFVTALKAAPRPIRLTGTTSSAGDSDEGRLTLSQDRATAVRDLLVRGGVDPALIQVRGVGNTIPPCVPDRDGSGNLEPVPAARNRQVIIEPA